VWDDLHRVDWDRLTHAYGWARDVPIMLQQMISADESTRSEGWEGYWGTLNHQGDFYDSTVAAIPFLIEALARPETPVRAEILTCFRDRWLDAPEYGGDPLIDEPPGGTNIPTPMLTDEELAAARVASASLSPSDADDEEEFDLDNYRRMDLCAWQTGRAIQAGRPVFFRLLDDPDRRVAAAAASLLLIWVDTRAEAKRALTRIINEETDPTEQARHLLAFGIYAERDDVDALAEWAAAHRPAPMRAAAALGWAWAINPEPAPEPLTQTLDALSAPDAVAFATLPWEGAWHRGPWILPANISSLALRLSRSAHKELRWRAVQALNIQHETAKHMSTAQIAPLLFRALSDPYGRIRSAAALALAQRGAAIVESEANAIAILIDALRPHQTRNWGDDHARLLDAEASTCGHAARLLAALSHGLTPPQRKDALAGLDAAIRRYGAVRGMLEYVCFGSMSVPVSRVLSEQRALIAAPKVWSVEALFAEIALPSREDRQLPLLDCDRMLAQAYAQAPEQTMSAAIEAVRTLRDRNVAIGAAWWLMTLGPAAKDSLGALDEMAAPHPRDPHMSDEGRAAAKAIRQSLLTASAAKASAGRDGALVAQLARLLEHSDAAVRTDAAEALARLAPTRDDGEAITPALVRMLDDDAVADIGISGEHVCAERLFHWRRERRSPRAGALLALQAMNWPPGDERMLKAMLAEAIHPKVLCGRTAEPIRFPLAQWRRAVHGVSQFSAADQLIRKARQHCLNAGMEAYACGVELARVIQWLSGRLV
jgi:HEAT repeat protein